MNMYRTNACRTTTNKKGVDLKAKIDNNFEVMRDKKQINENERSHRLDALITPVIHTIGFLLILTGVYSLIINNL